MESAHLSYHSIRMPWLGVCTHQQNVQRADHWSELSVQCLYHQWWRVRAALCLHPGAEHRNQRPSCSSCRQTNQHRRFQCLLPYGLTNSKRSAKIVNHMTQSESHSWTCGTLLQRWQSWWFQRGKRKWNQEGRTWPPNTFQHSPRAYAARRSCWEWVRSRQNQAHARSG